MDRALKMLMMVFQNAGFITAIKNPAFPSTGLIFARRQQI
jgi:hypothetical protein